MIKKHLLWVLPEHSVRKKEENSDLGAIALLLCVSQTHNNHYPEVTCTGDNKSSIRDIYDVLAKWNTPMDQLRVTFLTISMRCNHHVDCVYNLNKTGEINEKIYHFSCNFLNVNSIVPELAKVFQDNQLNLIIMDHFKFFQVSFLLLEFAISF